MTDFSDFKTQITEWANREDWSDALVTSFVRMAEQYINRDLRITWMIKTAINTITCRCSTLPDDWLQMDLVEVPNWRAPDGSSPIRYKSNDEFFNLTDRRAFGYYTLVGRTLHLGGTPDFIEGIRFNIAYYGDVPVFSDTVTSWVYTKYPSLYLSSALMHADLHAIGEEDSASVLKAQVDETIAKLNAQDLIAKASGSRITRTRRRGFG